MSKLFFHPLTVLQSHNDCFQRLSVWNLIWKLDVINQCWVRIFNILWPHLPTKSLDYGCVSAVLPRPQWCAISLYHLYTQHIGRLAIKHKSNLCDLSPFELCGIQRGPEQVTSNKVSVISGSGEKETVVTHMVHVARFTSHLQLC